MNKKLLRYFELIRTNPELFLNVDSPFEIIDDPKLIQKWQKTRRKEIRQNNIIHECTDIGLIMIDEYYLTVKDLIRFPSGKLGPYIRIINTASLLDGIPVAILPIFKNKILLLEHYRHATRKWHWEIPRGFGAPGISAEDQAKVEIHEEIGGVISDLVSLGEIQPDTGFQNNSVQIFIAKLTNIDEAQKDEGIRKIVLLTPEDLEKWIDENLIIDSYTICAWTLAKIRGLIQL